MIDLLTDENMIDVNDTLYTFTDHFIESMEDRNIKVEWVESVMQNPVRYELSEASSYYIYDGNVEGYKNLFRVVVDEDAKMLITAYFVV